MAPKKKSVASESTETKSNKAAGTGTRSKTGATPAPAIQPVPRPADFKGMEQLVFVDASTLKDHPDNWKTHTERQLKALDAEFSTVGWVLPLVYNLTTGRLLDGHGRKRTEWVKSHKIVPVVVGRWAPEEEDQILLHLDPIGAMFETEGPKYRALMDRYRKEQDETITNLSAEHRDALEDLNKSLDIHNESIDYGAPTSFLPDYTHWEKTTVDADKVNPNQPIKLEDTNPTLPGLADLKTFYELPFDCFGTGGALGIVGLRPEMLADAPGSMQTWVGPETPDADHYFYIYGCAAIEKVRSNKLIVAYYTHDRKFESIWNDPRPFTARMLNFQIHAAVTPNYSPWSGSPLWFDAYQTGRARWLGRYWQEAGIKIIPDITLSMLDNEQVFAMRMTGIPKGLPCISVQVQQKGDNTDAQIAYAWQKKHLLKVLKYLQPQQLILYHGPDLPANFLASIPQEIQVIEVHTWMWERGKILREKEYLSDKAHADKS